MARRRNGKYEFIAEKEDSELLPALAGLELKRRQLTEELHEVLVQYRASAT